MADTATSDTIGAALVTGANRGIGLAMLGRLAGRGPAIGTYRGNRPEPDPVAGADWAQLDVTDPGGALALAQWLHGRPLSLLVCNAGVYLDKGHAMQTGFGGDLWARSFATNVTGVFQTIQALMPNLRAAGSAKVAIISSAMASDERAPGGSYIYRASKAAVLNLGRNLAVDLKDDNIAVGIYHPGWVSTDMGGAGADIDVDTAAEGLLARFDALSLDQTGCFLTYDGTPIPF